MASGEIIEGVYPAESVEALRREFEQKEYFVFSIRPRNAILGLLRPSAGGGKRIKTKEFLIFNQELASLVHAGLPILACLDLLIERRKNPAFRKALVDIREQVRSGSALSEAFASQSHQFPPLYSSTLASGERSGEIETVVRRYLKYSKTMLNLRSKVVSALIYPAILIFMAVVLVSVLIYYVLPSFSAFYQELGVEQPLLTQIVVGSALLVRDNAWALAVLGVGAYLGVVAAQRTEAGRVRFDRLKLRVPMVGRVLHKYSIANMSRTLGTLIAGGIPVVQALEIANQAISNNAFRAALTGAAVRVREGHPMWESLERTGLMTDLAIEMIKVGESTGSLEGMLGNVAEFYDEELDNDLATIVAVIQPLLLIFMAVVVLVMVLAVYLPIVRGYTSSQY
jgi:type IV pilus assembly protein PilC